jgi:hypothetical protein
VARVEKTVFISYRRVDRFAALLVFKDLTQHGYDVFIDYDGIASGDFERSILDNIHARAHFVLILTPGALDRRAGSVDWLHREIEAAIKAQRNVVPLLFRGFDFSSLAVDRLLTGAVSPLRGYNALEVPDSFFDEAMGRLRSRYLAVPIDSVLHPPSQHAQLVALEQQQVAAAARPHGDSPPWLNEDLQAVLAAGQIPAEAVAAVKPALASPMPLASGPAGAEQVVDAAVDPDLGPTAGQSKVSWLTSISPVLKLVSSALLLLWLLGLWIPSLQKWAKPEAIQFVAPAQNEPIDPVKQNDRADDFFFGRNGKLQSDVEAMKWFRKSAEQGDPYGQANLGFMYETGRGGLKKDDAEAFSWFLKSAQQGHPLGQVYFGQMHENGLGGAQKDEAQAVKWYQRSADQGDSSGQAFLASMYEEGRGGLRKDRTEAIRLYRLAAVQGQAFAQDALKRLSTK